MTIHKFNFRVILLLCSLTGTMTQTLAQNNGFQSRVNANIYDDASNLLTAYSVRNEMKRGGEKANELSYLSSFFHHTFASTDTLKKMWFDRKESQIAKNWGIRVNASYTSNDSERGLLTLTWAQEPKWESNGIFLKVAC